MKIAVDCRMMDQSGIGVYLRGILPFFLQSEHSFLLLGNAQRLLSFASYANAQIINCSIKPFSVRELLFFPLKIRRALKNADVIFSPFFNIIPASIPIFTTIHDIIFPDMPELTSKAGLAARMFFYRKAYKKSQAVFTVSEFSKSRIVYHLGKSKPVIVTHSAIQPKFIEYRTKHCDIKKNEIIVFIGNIKKHKGIDCLLDAFYLARKEGLSHKLIIIGQKENLRSADSLILKKLDHPEAQAVLFTGSVSDEQLMEYLSAASLLVQPSLYEGFCLPPLEAMVLGTYALISDIPVLKEIYSGFPVTFFRAGDPVDLKEKLLKILLNKKILNIPLPDHLKEKYTFDKTASIILDSLTRRVI